MKTRGVKLNFTKLNASFSYEKKGRQQRPLLEGLFEVQKSEATRNAEIQSEKCKNNTEKSSSDNQSETGNTDSTNNSTKENIHENKHVT
jgi:hypothetical protein